MRLSSFFYGITVDDIIPVKVMRHISPSSSSGAGGLRWYKSDLLTLPHAMLCRCGGVSQPPFASLNLSLSVGDHPAAVQENRERLKQLFGIQHLVSSVQVHRNRVALVEDITADYEYKAIDALVTRQRGVGLLIQQADCQAILLHDPKKTVIAAVHSGWKGSSLNIIAETIAVMEERCGVNPADLRAVISPSLGSCCAEFINYATELPKSLHHQQVKRNYFDFWAISRCQLIEAGLENEHIETTGICTVCDKEFFSYRRASAQLGKPGKTGRNGSVLILPAEA